MFWGEISWHKSTIFVFALIRQITPFITPTYSLCPKSVSRTIILDPHTICLELSSTYQQIVEAQVLLRKRFSGNKIHGLNKKLLSIGTSFITFRIVERLACNIWALFILHQNRTKTILYVATANSDCNLTGEKYDKRHRHETL